MHDHSPTPAGIAGRIFAPILRIYRRRRLYDELMAMDDRQLTDIGITRGDIPNVVGPAGNRGRLLWIAAPRRRVIAV